MNHPVIRLFGPLVRYLARPGPLPSPVRRAALRAISWLYSLVL
jgi:hypothetical protein